jgi:hypothetical protein
MFKNYIIRKDIYDDEIHDESTFRIEKCVILEKGRHALIEIKDEKVKVIVKDLYYFIAYVNTDEKALEIAARWIKEESQNNQIIYTIKGIDSQYSIFN